MHGPARHGVVVHHPSRAPTALGAFATFERRLAAARPGFLLWALGGDVEVVVAHAAATPGGEAYVIAPLLIAPGSHFIEDVAAVAAAVGARRPDLTIHTRRPLLDDDAFCDAWLGAL